MPEYENVSLCCEGDGAWVVADEEFHGCDGGMWWTVMLARSGGSSQSWQVGIGRRCYFVVL